MSTLSSQIANLSPEQLAKLAYELKASKASKQQEIARRAPGDPCPLSFAQQRLWFIAQLEPDSPFYNCMEALRMTGKLNVALLEQVFNEVVRRHDALRTTFTVVDGEPVQIVSPEIKLDHRVIDLEYLPASEREKQVSKLSSEELRRLFDLTRGPLLRVKVLRISEHEHAIVFTTHHIISDGWSRDVLIREIIDLYSAFVEGRPSPLAELPFQYADFAISQRQRLTGARLEKHLDYWQRHLAGAPHVLALPADRPRPAVVTRRGSYEVLTLAPELSHSLRALARGEGVTLFMTMLAAFEVLLSRYSGQTDFLVGTDIANREHGTTESLIGFFVNQLVLRADLAGDPTFNELLKRVKEVTLNGYAHQDAPFEKVVDMLKPQRNLSHAPLFQVKLVLQYASTDNLELPELAMSGVESEASIAKLDLTLLIYDGDPISAVVEYSTDLFESSTIKRMLAQFERLLRAAVRNPEQHISQLELLSSAERLQLLVEFNDTNVPYPHTQGIHELFEEQVALAPDAPAVTFQGEHLSYAELNSRANQLAHYLRQLGVETETPVGVCVNRSIDLIVAIIAILKAGGVYVPLDPEYPAERLAFILEDVAPPIVLTHSSLVSEAVSTRSRTLCLDTESELWSGLPTTDLAGMVSSSDQLAYVMYTSGSTGNPKGVAVPQRAVVRLVKQSAYVDFGPDEVFLQLAPVTFDASTLEIWGPLLNGGRLVLMPPGAPSLADLGAVLRSEGVTVLWLTAGLFHLMVEQELEALASVRQVVAGGDVLSVEHVRRLLRAKGGRGVVVNGYGPTETTTFACCHRMSDETELDQGVPIGSPIGNTQVYVLGEKLELVGAGMLGELYIGGPGLARGYHQQPELTAERFVPHPFSDAGDRLYRTGDYVRWRAGGTLEFVGRRDTQVKIRGYRVEPGEVEAVLGQHASVSDCAVVMRQESEGQKYLVAYVVARANGDSESTFDLRAYLRDRLPGFMIPAAFVTLDSLPLTPNGKVDRRELAAREVYVGSERPYVPPRTITEEMLCDIWAEVLHVERVGIDDNFFDLGGDSILTTQVIAKARAVGLELNVRQLFQYQTVHELAHELDAAQEICAPVIETAPFSLISEADREALPVDVVDAYPLTALQAGMLFHSELAPEAGYYHDIFSFHLRLPFEAAALQAALQQLIDLHPVLRTSFNLSDFSEPLQLVHQEVAVPLRMGDLRALSPEEQEEYLSQWLEEEKQHRFDWREAPLLRFQIEQRSEESFQFSFSFHHAILDGWSVATLLTELFNVYSVLRTGERQSAAPVSASFRDYVAAERAVLESVEARQYWTTLLSDSTQTRLPRLIEAGPMRVAASSEKLAAEVVQGLKELARTAGVPLKSVLLAAHLRVLSMLSGSDDVLTGLVSHGRTETKDSERVLGLFLNTLPFRQKLSGGTWLELVQETFQAERASLPYRRYPMARMQQDLGNHEPLFETIFSYTHFHVYDEMQDVGGVKVLGYKGVGDTNFMFGVDFSLDLEGSGIEMELDCDAGQWSESQLKAATRYYLTTLEEMARTPLARYEQQSLLSSEERRTILYEWNEPAADFYSDCYPELFEAQVARTPDALAATLDGEKLTYAELNRRANQLAHYLQTLGVGPEVPVGVLLERSLESIVTLLAIFKAGGVYVPVDPQQPAERLQYLMTDARLTVLLTHTRFKELLPLSAHVVYLDSERHAIESQSTDNPVSSISPANLAYVIYTSGSTGRPRGVAVSHEAVAGLCAEIQQLFELRASDRVLVFYSFSFDVSLEEILPPLLIGASLVIRGEKIWTSSEFVRALTEDEISIIDLPTAYWHKLTEDCIAADALTSTYNLRLVVLGGEVVLPEKVRLWQSTPMRDVRLLVGYGPTEAVVTSTWFEVPAPLPETWSLPTIPIGRGLAGRTAYVLDSHGELAPVGVAGELHLGGPMIGRGYLHPPELTAEKFIPDRFSEAGGGRLYRTGDLARYLPDGNLEFLGRMDHQVKIRGFRVELEEIEAALKQHANVKEAVVVYAQERLIAYAQLRTAEAVGTSALRAYLEERLPKYMVPGVFVELPEFPLTPGGKIDRRALPAAEAISIAETEYEAPRSAVEELLAGLWASVLRVDRIGINDNFFELGGHSLLAIQLISRLRDTFGVELPLSDLFERPTVSELAQSIEDRMRANQGLVTPPLRQAPRDGELPLSFAQQRLWFLDQLVPENIAYNVADALRLRGELNVAALEQSINEIRRRHEALRTTFPEVDGNPIQVIAPFRHLDLPLIDLSSLPDRDHQAVKIAAAEAQRPFDLQSGPLLRATLLRLGREDHAILFSMHHIICDEWSTAILTREVTALYDAFTTGNASPLPDLAIQYGDFTVWQRQWLSGDVLSRQLDYWTSKLQGVPPLLALPTDHPRPKVQLTEGAFYTHLLDAELTSGLKSLAQQSKATLYMTVMAGFHALLHHYAQQATIVTGTVVSTRTQVETEPLIGFFVNTLAVRSDFDDDPTFATHLSRLRKHALEAYAHQDLPFEMLVDELQLARDLSYHPLFQVMFSWEEAAWDELELNGLELGEVAVENLTSQFDLMLRIGEVKGQIRCNLQYNTALFDVSTIKRMLAQFQRLLGAAVRDPEQHISQLELLSSAERQQLLVEFNDTNIPYPHTQGIHELFEEQVALAPDAPAVTFQGQHLSYAELNSRANQLAHYLRQLGVEAETPVGVCVNRSVDLIVAIIAILKAGGVYVPLDPEYPIERLAFILEDVLPPVILTHSSLVDEMPSTWAQTLSLDTDSELWSGLPTTDLAGNEGSSDQLAYVMYTSGSTGNPKGVAVPQRAVVRLVKQSAYVDFGADEVFLQLAPVTFDAATLEIWGPLLNGGRLVLMPPGAPSLADLGAALRSEGVTVLWLTAGLFHLMVEQELEALASVRQVVAGGDVLSVEHVRRLLRAKDGNGVVINGYGPTETTTFACCHRMSDETELDQGVPIGSPIGNTQVYVLGEKLELVGAGMLGELYIGGPGLARGYHQQPELTAERFVPHPFSEAGDRLYRTGDYVRWRAGGTLEFVGRRDTQVKIRGYRVEPGEVEAVLGQHGSVQDCAVVTRREANGEKRLVAYVVYDNGEHDAFELREYLRERLPEFMLPSAIVAIESLPLTPNGKVDRRELAAREVYVGGEQSYVPPRTSTEELLCGVWAEVLRAERVGIHDNFFDLGGDSILTIQVIVKARAVGLELNVRQLFQFQTVYELAQELAGAQEGVITVEETEPFSLISEADRAALPAGVEDAYPLTALQAGMLFHSELAPEAGYYHDIFSFHLRLPFDSAVLQAALQQLIDLHPVLRTSFNLSDFSEPLQLVHEDVAVPLRMGDLRALSPDEQEEYLSQWLEEERQHRFDWREAPLLRFQIEQRSEESFQFSFSFHHAILDGWSVATLLTELFNVYSVRPSGERLTAAPVSASFRDYVAAERAVLESAEAREYWTTLLSDSTQTRLPRLIEAGPMRVAASSEKLSAEVVQGLKELARTAGVPVKSVLLAAHLRVLSMLSGSDDVLTGLVSHGRTETKDSERVLGLFLNTLPFRQKLSGGTWLELVQETFQAERASLPFRRYPMARMQQDLGNHEPLFETIFNYTHFHVYDEMQNVGGVKVLGYKGVGDTNYMFGVDFSLDLEGSAIKMQLHCDAGQWSESQLEAATRYHLTTLEEMARTPLARYEQQSLLSTEERRTILYEWNEPVADVYSDCYPELFEAQVARTPDALAATLDGEKLTYAELNSRANQLAHYLQTLGVGPEVPVGVLLERSLDTFVALFAILKAGGVYVPLDAQQPSERQQYIVDDARIAVLLTHTRFKDVRPEAMRVVYLDLERENIAAQSTANVGVALDPANLAYVIYTSGSTGQPKGVAVSHEAVARLCAEIQQLFELRASDRVLAFYSFSFDASLEEILPPLLIGASLVIRGEKIWTSSEFVRALGEDEISIIDLPTAYWHKLTEDCIAADVLTSTYNLRLVVLGGEAVLPEKVRLWQSTPMRDVRLLVGYGPTEAVVTSTWFEVPAPLPESWSLPTIPIGRGLAGRTAYVLDSHGELAPVGVAGELHLGGPMIARGYLHRAELTAEKFIPDRFSEQPGGRLYRTGDLARYLPDGNLEFLGRMDHQVKIRGFRVELEEIEAALKQHANVKEAVVVYAQERLLAYIQLRTAEAVGTSALRAYLEERLPRYMVPGVFVELPEFPLTPGGKIDRRALPAAEAISIAETEYEAPRSAVEELLAGLWASVLRVDRVGINDNFFELGGHSLLAIQLISRLREAFNLELPLTDLFERPTVSELAQSIEDRMRADQGLVTPPLRQAPRDRNLPLSFAQQRLWFLHQLMPESIAYNMAGAIRLGGELNVAALEQSINEIKRRHEALRTTFHEVEGNPIQVITPFHHFTLPLIDLSSLPDRDHESARLAAAEAQRPFDLQSGPLLRATLLRLGADDHVLLFSMHHIISDGWSTDLLAREMAALYGAFSTGTASPLSDLAIQYGDFAVWQREWLSGDVLARQLDYWTSKLQGVPPLLTLPTDYPRPKAQLNEGAFSSRLINAEMTTALKSLAQKNGATLFMTMLAGFHALLHRYAQQATIVTGVPVANRMRAETEPLIGFFVNTLALRSDFDGDPTFLTHLNRLRKHALESYVHQDLPFEMLVDELQLTRDLSYNPLFQVMFSWEEAAWDELALTGTEPGSLGVENRTSQFDLTLWVGEINGQLRCSMQYNTSLFAEDTIARMLGHYEQLLSSALREPQQQVSRLALLRSEERQQLLGEWNETAAPYETGVTLGGLFERQVAQDETAVAVVSGDREITYGELNERANRVARHLRDLGVGAESRVGLLVDRGLEMVVGLLGIVKAGAAYVPLDPGYPRARLEYMIANAAVTVLLTEQRQQQLAKEIEVGTLLYLDDAWVEKGSGENLGITIDSENLAYVIYTSGSTGQPKGVMNTHRGICNRLFWMQDVHRITTQDRLLQKTPYSFDVSVWEFFWPLLNGACLVMAEPGGHQNPAYLRDVIQREQITIMHFVPAMLQAFLQEPELERCTSLRKVFCSGEALGYESQQQFFARLGAELYNLYGPTEAAVEVTHWTCNPNSARKVVPIGRPIANTQIHLLDQNYEPVPVGVAGELHIGGVNLARGYQENPRLTAEMFIPNPFSNEPGARLYKTGDLARHLPDGSIEFLGRRDTQVKIRGYRVEPGEVEEVLGQHGSVTECAVVIRRETNGELRLVAYVVDGNDDPRVNASELREYLRERLPEFMVPSAIVQIESLPLTSSGKVDRRELAAREVRVASGGRSYVPPRTITEELLCAVWVDVLRAERVGIHDNFFDLGGDSILTIQVIAKARALGLELNVQQLFQHQTVHELAQELERSSESSLIVEDTEPFSLISEADRAALPAGVVDAYPLTALQAGMLFHSELAPDDGIYHFIYSFHLQLPFDGEALRATLQQLIDRHPVLRSSFNLSDYSEPLQLVHQEVAVPLRIGDLRLLSLAEQEEYLAQWLAAEKQRRFDWSNAPLMRFQIERRSEESFQFSFSFHHAILDGWSVATMLTELFDTYSVMQTEERASTAPLNASFRDFVAAEQAALKSEEARQYWTTTLSEATQSRLPRLAQSAGPSRMAAHTVSIAPELSSDLRELARTAGVPLKSVLLAAHLRVLSVLTGSDDVLTGIVSHGRPETEDGERVLGLFLNTLPFRRYLAGGTWLQLVQETFAAERESLPFRRYPLARMQQDIGNETPLFEVIFNFMHFHVSDELQTVSGLEVLGSDGSGYTNFTLAVDFSLEQGSQLKLELQYDAAELNEEQIEAMGRDYLTVLESMTRRPLQRYEHECLLSPEERQKILYDWNDTTLDLDNECYLHLFEAQVARTPNALAAVAGAEQLTYEELNRRANQLAHYLQAVGVGLEVPVGVLLDRSLETIVALFAIFKAGGAYVPLDPEYPEERLRFMANDAGLELVITKEKLSSLISDTAVKSIRMDVDWPEIANESEDNLPVLSTASNLAYIIYTSGSSGTPKGAMVTQGGFVNCLQWMQQRYELTEQDGFLMHTSLNFDPSVWEVFWPLMVGGRVVVVPSTGMMDSSVLHYMAEQKVSCAYFVPSLLGVLVKEPRLSVVSSLRYLISGGEKLPLGVMQEFQELSPAELHHSYGPTETAIAATEWTCVAGAERVLMGKPIANTQLYVLDGQMEPLPVGVAGELYIGGAGVGRGYAGQAELTAERFVPDRFSGEVGARLYRTGDLVRYDDDGNLEFLGRVDEQVKLRGYRIELGEIEAVLRRHQQVSAAVVVLREEQLVAYVVSDAPTSELREYLKAQLPNYMVPSLFVTLNELPLLPNGKINRRALPSPIQSTTSDSLTTPRDVLELQLIQIWKEVLGREQIGLRESFLDLGGHSLLALRLISKIERVVGQKIPLSVLFQGATIEQLAATLRQRGERVGEQSLVTIQPDGSRPPLFLVHSASGNVMSYLLLSRRLGREQPVYGLQSRGVDPDREPTSRVEDMAAEYLGELIAVQPEGPYHLGGWSMGGVIAFEMARQLSAQGKSVAPVVLIDSTIQTGRAKKNGWDDVSLLLALAQHHGLFLDETFEEFRSLSLDEQLELFLEKGAAYDQFPRDIGVAQLRHFFELFKVNVRAAENYRAAKSGQQVILLQAAEAPRGHAATVLRHWEKVAEVVEAHRLPGDHYSILTEPNVTLLAEQINPYLGF